MYIFFVKQGAEKIMRNVIIEEFSKLKLKILRILLKAADVFSRNFCKVKIVV